MARVPRSRDDSLVHTRYTRAPVFRRRTPFHAGQERRNGRFGEPGGDGSGTDVAGEVRSDARVYDCVDDCCAEGAADGTRGEGEAGGCGEEGVGGGELDACD